jgi:hypothetical protein
MTEDPPIYTWDYESISACPDPLAVVQFLAEVTSRPGFRLSRVCGLCEAWDRGYVSQEKDVKKPGLGLRPRPPGAHDATVGCHGCWYSYIEEPAEHQAHRDRGFSDYLLARMREGLDAIPAGHPDVTRRRVEYEARIREFEEALEAKPESMPRKRGRVLAMYLEVVE